MAITGRELLVRALAAISNWLQWHIYVCMLYWWTLLSFMFFIFQSTVLFFFFFFYLTQAPSTPHASVSALSRKLKGLHTWLSSCLNDMQWPPLDLLEDSERMTSCWTLNKHSSKHPSRLLISIAAQLVVMASPVSGSIWSSPCLPICLLSTPLY